jgi:hypothetical protein
MMVLRERTEKGLVDLIGMAELLHSAPPSQN